MVTRRAFLALAALLPAIARSQPAPRKPVHLAWFSGGSHADQKVYVDAFLDGMKGLGYREGRDFVIEYFWQGETIKPTGWQARDVVSSKPDVILATCEVTVNAVKKIAGATPIVMTAATDPVASGVVQSLARPGGNVTGISSSFIDVSVKRVEMLKELLPRADRMAFLRWRWEVVSETDYARVEKTARNLGMAPSRFEAEDEADFDRVMGEIRRAQIGGIVDLAGLAIAFPFMKVIPELALKHRLAVVHFLREAVEQGGLVSYGPSVRDGFRRSAYYVDRIAKGAKPSELPIEQPASFETCVNLKTAKALGITMPQSILLRAQTVIG